APSCPRHQYIRSTFSPASRANAAMVWPLVLHSSITRRPSFLVQGREPRSSASQLSVVCSAISLPPRARHSAHPRQILRGQRRVVRVRSGGPTDRKGGLRWRNHPPPLARAILGYRSADAYRGAGPLARGAGPLAKGAGPLAIGPGPLARGA